MIVPSTMLDPHKKSPLPRNNSLPRLWFQLHEAYEAAEAPPATLREVKRRALRAMAATPAGTEDVTSGGASGAETEVFLLREIWKIWEYILLDDDDDDDDIHMPSNV